MFVIAFFSVFSMFLSGETFYNMDVKIDNKNNFIKVDAEIHFDETTDLVFYLNKNLFINSTDYFSFFIVDSKDEWYKYRVSRKMINQQKDGERFNTLKFSYQGKIYYPLKSKGTDYHRGFKESKGIISEDGCFINLSTYWYPYIKNENIKFHINVETQKDYDVITPGYRVRKEIIGDKKITTWQTDTPVEDIPLVCGKYYEYSRKYNDLDLYVFLRSPDELLAKRYLDYGKMYIDAYSHLIGDYAYKKFAVVENFWETGYGFASFTLIGPVVLRFPFILNSSYPHEILHNWWGNGVFVDYEKGNWSEGLTAYMADYLIQEEKGKDIEYRKTTIKTYNDFVNENNEFSLLKFKERENAWGQAIGYGKSLMFFHTIRNKIGDNKFIESLRDFYKTMRFKKAGWDDLKYFFEKHSGENLDYLFDEFVVRTKAPVVEISKVDISNKDKSSTVKLKLNITDGYKLDIPVKFYFEDGSYEKRFLFADSKRNSFKLNFSRRLNCIWVDSDYEMIRKLLDDEMPQTLSRLNGSDNVALYISDNLSRDISQIDFKKYKVMDRIGDLKSISSDLLILSDIGDMLNLIDTLNYGIRLSTDSIWINNTKYYLADNNFVFSFENPYNKKYSINFIIGKGKNIVDLLSKIIHYSKYSYLVFDNDLELKLSGIWEKNNSPLLYCVDKGKKIDNKSEKKGYGIYPYRLSREKIDEHLKFLSVKLKTRDIGSDEINLARDYIADNFKKIGLSFLFNDSYLMEFDSVISSKAYKMFNVCGYIKNSTSSYLLISAHYDHLFPENGFFPGASDNASGVALMIELARYFYNNRITHSIVFCGFSGEEEGRLGSKYFLNNLVDFLKGKIVANINIDTIGRLNGRDLTILNSFSSKKWQLALKNASYLSSMVYRPVSVQLDSSDQMSFIEKSIPAIQIFDGGDLTYHKKTDIYETIDIKGIMDIGEFVIFLVEESSKYDKFDFIPPSMDYSHRKRKVSLGFMPDFSYSGKGVRISRIIGGSLISKTDIKEGDVIIKLNGMDIDNLITYTNALSQIESNDISIEYISNNETKKKVIKVDN